MNAKPIAVLVCALLAGAAQGQERADGWVGKAVPPLPAGVVEQSGTCIGDGKGGVGPGELCHHSVAVVFDPQAKLRTVLVIRELPHFGPNSIGLVADALEPAELDDPQVQVAAGTCRESDEDDGRIVALVRPREAEWLAPVRAWRVDADGRLQAVPAKRVQCRNEGFGYDG